MKKTAKDLEEKFKYEEALKMCDKILSYNSLSGPAYQVRAWINFRQGNNQLLEENGLKAITLEPKNAVSNILMSAIYDTKGLYESAKASNQKALSYTHDPQQISQIYSNSSLYYEWLNQKDSAIYFLKKSIHNSPLTHAFWRLAILFQSEGSIDSADFYFNKGLANKPMDNYLQTKFYNDYSAFLLMRSGESQSPDIKKDLTAKAKMFVLKALEIDPNDSESKLLLNNIEKVE